MDLRMETSIWFIFVSYEDFPLQFVTSSLNYGNDITHSSPLVDIDGN
jgi:hypothetical protein